MPSASRAGRLDAVTVDAFGTMLLLEDPTEALRSALGERGIERSSERVEKAFRAEAAHYRPRSLRGRDVESLTCLRRECVAVFLDVLDVDLEPAAFVAPFLAAIAFRPADGAEAALDRLRAAGLALACVANWDAGLHEHLERLGLDMRFEVVLSSAEAGAAKPDPAIFEIALARLGVTAGRVLHVGDEDDDRLGAAAAGITFEPVPLATLPERLDL